MIVDADAQRAACRCTIRSRYADGMPRRRRRRRPIAKLAEYQRARWYFGRGCATSVIAAKLGVSETTVRKWRALTSHDHVFAQLRRRVMLLPEWQRDQLITDLVDQKGRSR